MHSWLYNLFIGLFQGQIQNAVQSSLQQSIQQAIDQNAEQGTRIASASSASTLFHDQNTHSTQHTTEQNTYTK